MQHGVKNNSNRSKFSETFITIMDSAQKVTLVERAIQYMKYLDFK